MAKKQEKFIILDGNALIHRSFHALPPTMTTKNGQVVNAVYGFTTVLFKVLREFKPNYIALTLDRKGPTFRHKKFKEYKAKRLKAPDELYAQIPLVKELAGNFSIPVFEKEGFEADDLIGAITSRTDESIENIIVTGDMDALQLVDGHTKVYKLGRGLTDINLFDAKLTKVHYGIRPDQVIDYKALRGDPSDNIPGVRGVGEKTALDLLGKFDTLDGIYENIDSGQIKDRPRSLLKEHKDEAYLSRELATIRQDVKIEFDLDELRFGNFNKEAIIKFLTDMEFKSLLPRLHALLGELSYEGSAKADDNTAPDKYGRNLKKFDYRLVDDEKKFKTFLDKLKKRKIFAFDTETTSFDPLDCSLLGVSFSWKNGQAYYLNMAGTQGLSKQATTLFNYQKQEKLEAEVHPWIGKLKKIFEDGSAKKCAHNMKFDYRVMQSVGVETQGLEFDTMIASYLLKPGSRQHSLDALSFTELRHEKISKDDLLGSGRDRIGFADVELERLYNYSCEDADCTWRLVERLKKQLGEHKQTKLFREIEMPLVRVLADMENKGIHIDKKFLGRMKTRLDKRIKSLEAKIHKQAGEAFNVRSTVQLKEILFEKLEIPTMGVKKTKTGFSTSADELDKLRDQHPIIRLIQEHRELSKLMSTYIESLPGLINKKTGRVHTSFNQTVTATGRLSSTDPNLQNIPIRTELGREIRKAFTSQKGYKLLALDYSQIELRLAAHMSEDKKMIKAFRAGADIHTSTAAEIQRIDTRSVDAELRREAKAINFGILYGQGPHGLSRTADIPYWRAKEFIDQYFKVYTGIRKYIDAQIKLARERGYVETLFGRRRYLPEINSTVMMVKKGAERMAVNAPLQGTSADITKVAMLRCFDLIQRKYRDDARMLLQVHDELVFEVKNSQIKKAAKDFKKIMEEVIKLKVPVVVDAKAGVNWGEMEEVL